MPKQLYPDEVTNQMQLPPTAQIRKLENLSIRYLKEGAVRYAVESITEANNLRIQQLQEAQKRLKDAEDLLVGRI